MTYNERGRQKRIRVKSLVSRKHPLCIVTMTAQMMTAIMHVVLKAEINCEKTLGWFSFVLKLN